MSCLLNNRYVSPCPTLSLSLFLPFTDRISCVYTSIFIPELQAYRRATESVLLRRDITFTRQDFYEANFMSLSVVAEKERFSKTRKDFIHSSTSPKHMASTHPTQDRNVAIAPESGLDCWPGLSAPASAPSQQTEFYKEKGEKKTTN